MLKQNVRTALVLILPLRSILLSRTLLGPRQHVWNRRQSQVIVSDTQLVLSECLKSPPISISTGRGRLTLMDKLASGTGA